jgi:hypothetical protein
VRLDPENSDVGFGIGFDTGSLANDFTIPAPHRGCRRKKR